MKHKTLKLLDEFSKYTFLAAMCVSTKYIFVSEFKFYFTVNFILN